MQKNKSLQRKVKVTCTDHYFGAFFFVYLAELKVKGTSCLIKKKWQRNSDNFLLGLLERNLIFYNLS